ncbi:UDP-forming cellulose synthase catalytic subunit [Lichenifustis flavocetrariae]|uniref:Cellulose synthase catalytic subunit [UDP-forming] n=1 Tax=Lichenifustis flavocetrariae TaxID=2949735 RepID=A0AA42CMI8_9HYPH|nr:UDP-forming cellulose synthase catalytic subunit [Lichenifustis flavocetrariae]MCW6508390.1 UDP-forming cellulose synthase catalytic subunit [Lichenifustis flavocetrariae]
MVFAATAAWALLSVFVLIAAALPIGVEAQLAVAVACLTIMAAIKMTGLRGPFRPVFLGLGTFVILRYVFWRATSTIPSLESPLDFVPGVLLAVAEAYCVTMMFLSLFTVARPTDRPPAPRLSADAAPTVDVFVPSYNESVEILATTLVSAKAMHYPDGKLKIFLLDDGGTDEKVGSDDPDKAAAAMARRKNLQALCADLGVQYLTREQNTHAKAGNLNNGLINSDGEFVVIFDADHAPAKEFLRETVGYFSTDDRLFLVQTPHFFLNPDPIEKNLGARGMPAENEMFYGLVQKGLDTWNAAFFCGSAAVLRRQALEQVGGFHGSSITEDAETALELHSRRWKSLYIDKPMIAGLQPETFETFIGQRSRWCRGMVQILLLKNPLLKEGLTIPQRLCYLSSSMFWLFPLSRMAFIFAPMFYIFLNLKIYVANQQEFFAYTMTYMISAMMIQSYIFGRLRWPWASDVYEYIQSVHLFRAVLSVFVDPRRPKFNVTDKGLSLKESRLSGMALPYVLIFGLVTLSMGVIAFRYAHEPASRDMLTVVGVWTLLNMFLTGIALGAVSEFRERRTTPRVETKHKAVLSFGQQSIPVLIEDMSYGGLRVRVLDQTPLPVKALGTVTMTHPLDPEAVLTVPVATAGRRAFENGRGTGLKFYGVTPDRFRMLAEVVFSDIGRVHQTRSSAYKLYGVGLGTAFFVFTCLKQIGRGCYYVAFRRERQVTGSSPEQSAERNPA